MPLIRVNCPENSFTAEQEAEPAPLLVEAAMVEEFNPVGEEARIGTFVVFNEVPDPKAIGANGQPFWLVESFVAAPFFNQELRDHAQDRGDEAFIKVLGDDDSVRARREGDLSCLPGAHLLNADRHSRGQLGMVGGGTTSALEIGSFSVPIRTPSVGRS